MPESVVCQIINSSQTQVGIDAEHDGSVEHTTLPYGGSAAYLLDADSAVEITYNASPTPILKIGLKGTSTVQVGSIAQGMCLCMVDGTSVTLVPTAALRLTVAPGVNAPIMSPTRAAVAAADDDAGTSVEGVKCGEG